VFGVVPSTTNLLVGSTDVDPGRWVRSMNGEPMGRPVGTTTNYSAGGFVEDDLRGSDGKLHAKGDFVRGGHGIVKRGPERDAEMSFGFPRGSGSGKITLSGNNNLSGRNGGGYQPGTMLDGFDDGEIPGRGRSAGFVGVHNIRETAQSGFTIDDIGTGVDLTKDSAQDIFGWRYEDWKQRRYQKQTVDHVEMMGAHKRSENMVQPAAYLNTTKKGKTSP
jgi:hypothetical protein